MAYMVEKMGQQEIYNVLKENGGRKYTTKELSLLTNANQSSVTIACKKLRKHKFVKFQTIKEDNKYKNIYWV